MFVNASLGLADGSAMFFDDTDYRPKRSAATFSTTGALQLGANTEDSVALSFITTAGTEKIQMGGGGIAQFQLSNGVRLGDGTSGSQVRGVTDLAGTFNIFATDNMIIRPGLDGDGGVINLNNDDNENCIILPSGQGLTLPAGSGINMVQVNFAGDGDFYARAVTAGDGVQLADGSGTLRLNIVDDANGGFQVLDGSGSVNMILLDNNGDGEARFRPVGTGDVLQLIDGAGIVRVTIGDSTASGFIVRDSSNTVNMINADNLGSGDLRLQPVASGDTINLFDGAGVLRLSVADTSGVHIRNSDNTVSLVQADNSANGDLILEAVDSGDFVAIRSGEGLTLFQVDDVSGVRALNQEADENLFMVDPDTSPGEVIIWAEDPGDQFQVRDGNGNTRFVVGDASGVIVEADGQDYNLMQMDPNGNGFISFKAGEVGSAFQISDSDDVVRLQVTDHTIAGGYEVSVAGDMSTTGELNVAQNIRERGDQIVTSTTYTIETTASRYFFDTTSGSNTSTLPEISSSTRGQKFIFFYDVKSGSNTVTIQRAGSDTIDGATSVSLDTEHDKLALFCPSTGTDWKVEDEVSGTGPGGGHIIGGGVYAGATGNGTTPDTVSITSGAVSYPAGTSRIRIMGTHIHSAASQIQGGWILDIDLIAGTAKSMQLSGGSFTYIQTTVPTGTVTVSSIANSLMQVNITSTNVNVYVTHTAATSTATGYCHIEYFN